MWRNSSVVWLSILLITLTGCTGIGPSAPEATSTTTTQTTTPQETVDETQTATTQETIEGKGKTYLHVTKLNESEESEYDNPTDFQNLSAPKQNAFLKAKNCSCQIESTAFSFSNQDIHRVEYQDDIYLIYVTKH